MIREESRDGCGVGGYMSLSEMRKRKFNSSACDFESVAKDFSYY